MKKLGLLFFMVFASLSLFGCSQTTPTENTTTVQVSNMSTSQVSSQYQSKVKPDKIEIIEFHNTQRCATCLKAEELLKKTIETKFSEEAKNGLITFKDVNIDLPENAEITNKFGASGLSVAINTIIGGKDNIEYDMNGWRLVSNEEQYIQYFGEKIDALLGK